MGRGFALRPAAVAVAWFLALVMPAAGQEPDIPPMPSPILTLDQERLFNGSNVAERVSQEVERRSAELAAENRAIEAKLVAEELDLTERRPSLKPAEFRALANAFDEKVQRIRAEQDAKTRELQRLSEQARQNFLRRITPVLAEIVSERGAVVVLDRRSAVISAESIDITDEAIARINTALNSSDLATGTLEPVLPEGPAPVPDAPDPDQDPITPVPSPDQP